MRKTGRPRIVLLWAVLTEARRTCAPGDWLSQYRSAARALTVSGGIQPKFQVASPPPATTERPLRAGAVMSLPPKRVRFWVISAPPGPRPPGKTRHKAAAA